MESALVMPEGGGTNTKGLTSMGTTARLPSEDLDTKLTILLEAADLALGRLNGIIETIQSHVGRRWSVSQRRLAARLPRRPVQAPVVIRLGQRPRPGLKR